MIETRLKSSSSIEYVEKIGLRFLGRRRVETVIKGVGFVCGPFFIFNNNKIIEEKNEKSF